jgi:hypothetical protein
LHRRREADPGLSTSAANRLREEAEEESESARVGVRFGVSPNGGGVVVTGAFQSRLAARPA